MLILIYHMLILIYPTTPLLMIRQLTYNQLVIKTNNCLFILILSSILRNSGMWISVYKYQNTAGM